MGQKRISTGNAELNEFLSGGYETDIITTIFGPSGCGKTNLCIISACDIARTGKKVIYIDTEGGFSVKRLKQVADDSKEILEKIMFLRPTSFSEQKSAFIKLKEVINDSVGLIIVDTIGMLYRIELGKSNEIYEINRDLGKQISFLIEITRKKKIPVLITSQVYSSMGKNDDVNIVGGDILKYQSKCLLEIKKLQSNKRILILKKHRSISENKEFLFEIIHEGIKEVENNEKYLDIRRD